MCTHLHKPHHGILHHLHPSKDLSPPRPLAAHLRSTTPSPLRPHSRVGRLVQVFIELGMHLVLLGIILELLRRVTQTAHGAYRVSLP